MQFPMKTPGDIFLEINWLILKFIRETKGPRIVKMISKKEAKLKDSYYLISRLLMMLL